MATLFTSQYCSGIGQFAGYLRTVVASVARVDAAPTRSGDFDCEILGQKIGPLALLRISSDPVSLRRSSACIAGDPRTHYIVSLHRSGEGVLSQNDADVPIIPDTFVLIDKALPYEARFYDRSVRLLACIPRSYLEQRLYDAGRFTRMSIRADRGIGRIAATYLETLFGEAAHLDTAAQVRAAEVCVDLLVAAITSGGSDGSPIPHGAPQGKLKAYALLSRIRAHVRHHLSDPDLSPASIAAAHGISKRYLHALFTASGASVGAWTRQERLDRAHADLANPRLDHLSVTDIALRHGFNDIPHFSRSFKARYSQSPKRIRAAACAVRHEGTDAAALRAAPVPRV
jgi:AraC-like DNA-binding protein